jgi:hypothetical protein
MPTNFNLPLTTTGYTHRRRVCPPFAKATIAAIHVAELLDLPPATAAAVERPCRHEDMEHAKGSVCRALGHEGEVRGA